MSDIEIFPWSLHFATGVELIDAQHQELVRILNEICSGVLSTKDHDGAIDRLFLELISYTKRHFEREEAFFDQHDLPPQLVDDHKEKHRFLVAEAHRLKDYYENHPQDNNDPEELLTTLALWLTRHILSEEMWLVMVIDCLDNGMSLDEAKQHANQEMEGPADVSASVGVALYPEDGVQLDDLLRHADDAMYAAKKGGKNSYRLYSELAEKPA